MKKRVIVLALVFSLIGSMFSGIPVSAAHTHQYALVGGNSQVINTPHDFLYSNPSGTQIYMSCAASETHWTSVYKCSICGSTYNTSGVTYSHPNPYCPSH